MRTPRFLTRFLSAFLAFILFFTNSLFAHKPAYAEASAGRPENTLWQDRQNSLSLRVRRGGRSNPSLPIKATNSLDLNGRLLRSSAIGGLPRNDNPSIFHIQDVHQNHEAQLNISQTIQQLIKEGQVDLIALEGAFAPIDVSPFNEFPHQPTVHEVADYLLKENKISGPIHALLTAEAVIASEAKQSVSTRIGFRMLNSERRIASVAGKRSFAMTNSFPAVVGIDDRTYYHANVEAYRRAAPLADSAKKELAQKLAALQLKKVETFNADLAAFDSKVEAYRRGEVGLGAYLSSVIYNRSSINDRWTMTDSKWSMIDVFNEAYTLEKSLNFPRVEHERALLISKLVCKLNPFDVQRLTRLSLEFQQQQVRPVDFYKELESLCDRNGVSLKAYPAMREYLRYVVLSDQIDAEKLFQEMRELETSTYAALAKTDTEMELVAESRRLYLTGKLIDFALTKEEWEEYALTRPPATLSLQGEGRVRAEPFERFYKEAETRDRLMAENLIKAMKTHNAKRVVLVTGGFHAKGLQSRLTIKDYRLTNFIPRITKLDTDKGTAYLSVFSQEKTPLAKLFDGDKLFLSIKPLDREAVGLAGAHTLAKSVGRRQVSLPEATSWANSSFSRLVQWRQIALKILETGVVEVSGLQRTKNGGERPFTLRINSNWEINFAKSPLILSGISTLITELVFKTGRADLIFTAFMMLFPIAYLFHVAFDEVMRRLHHGQPSRWIINQRLGVLEKGQPQESIDSSHVMNAQADHRQISNLDIAQSDAFNAQFVRMNNSIAGHNRNPRSFGDGNSQIISNAGRDNTHESPRVQDHRDFGFAQRALQNNFGKNYFFGMLVKNQRVHKNTSHPLGMRGIFPANKKWTFLARPLYVIALALNAVSSRSWYKTFPFSSSLPFQANAMNWPLYFLLAVSSFIFNSLLNFFFDRRNEGLSTEKVYKNSPILKWVIHDLFRHWRLEWRPIGSPALAADGVTMAGGNAPLWIPWLVHMSATGGGSAAPGPHEDPVIKLLDQFVDELATADHYQYAREVRVMFDDFKRRYAAKPEDVAMTSPKKFAQIVVDEDDTYYLRMNLQTFRELIQEIRGPSASLKLQFLKAILVKENVHYRDTAAMAWQREKLTELTSVGPQVYSNAAFVRHVRESVAHHIHAEAEGYFEYIKFLRSQGWTTANVREWIASEQGLFKKYLGEILPFMEVFDASGENVFRAIKEIVLWQFVGFVCVAGASTVNNQLLQLTMDWETREGRFNYDRAANVINKSSNAFGFVFEKPPQKAPLLLPWMTIQVDTTDLLTRWTKRVLRAVGISPEGFWGRVVGGPGLETAWYLALGHAIGYGIFYGLNWLGMESLWIRVILGVFYTAWVIGWAGFQFAKDHDDQRGKIFAGLYMGILSFSPAIAGLFTSDPFSASVLTAIAIAILVAHIFHMENNAKRFYFNENPDSVSIINFPNNFSTDADIIEGLPSQEDLEAVLKKEKAHLVYAKPGSLAYGLLMNLKEFEHLGYYRDYQSGAFEFPEEIEKLRAYAGGVILSRERVKKIAEQIGTKPAEFLAELGFRPESEKMVVIEEGPTRHRALFEEVIHALEGYVLSNGNGLAEVREIVNDFIQVLFVPSKNISQFKSEYTDWSDQQKLNLQRLYGVSGGFNPNTDMKLILETLLWDIEQGSDVLGTDRDVAAVYLKKLLRTSHFQNYKALFPHWQPEPADYDQIERQLLARYRATGRAEFAARLRQNAENYLDRIRQLPENTLVIIQAGGRGTRLNEPHQNAGEWVDKNTEKLGGVSQLQRQLNQLAALGFRHVLVNHSVANGPMVRDDVEGYPAWFNVQTKQVSGDWMASFSDGVRFASEQGFANVVMLNAEALVPLEFLSQLRYTGQDRVFEYHPYNRGRHDVNIQKGRFVDFKARENGGSALITFLAPTQEVLSVIDSGGDLETYMSHVYREPTTGAYRLNQTVPDVNTLEELLQRMLYHFYNPEILGPFPYEQMVHSRRLARATLIANGLFYGEEDIEPDILHDANNRGTVWFTRDRAYVIKAFVGINDSRHRGERFASDRYHAEKRFLESQIPGVGKADLIVSDDSLCVLVMNHVVGHQPFYNLAHMMTRLDKDDPQGKEKINEWTGMWMKDLAKLQDAPEQPAWQEPYAFEHDMTSTGEHSSALSSLGYNMEDWNHALPLFREHYRQHPSPEVPAQGDYAPLNYIVTPNGSFLIDGEFAGRAPREKDLATAFVRMHQMNMRTAFIAPNPHLRANFAELMEAMVTTYEAHSGYRVDRVTLFFFMAQDFMQRAYDQIHFKNDDLSPNLYLELSRRYLELMVTELRSTAVQHDRAPPAFGVRLINAFGEGEAYAAILNSLREGKLNQAVGYYLTTPDPEKTYITDTLLRMTMERESSVRTNAFNVLSDIGYPVTGTTDLARDYRYLGYEALRVGRINTALALFKRARELHRRGVHAYAPYVEKMNVVISQLLQTRAFMDSGIERRERKEGERILIVGGLGFLGTQVLDQILLERSLETAEIIICDQRYPDANTRWPSRVHYFRADLRDPKAIDDLFVKYGGFSQVIHLAAMKSPNWSRRHPAASMQSNVLMGLYMACARYGTRIVQMSTAELYPEHKETPFNEEDRVDPTRNPYAASKYLLERIPALMGIDTVSVRLATLYGGSEQDGLVTDMLHALVDGRHLTYYGNVALDFLHVRDASQGIVQFVKNSKVKGIFNLSTGIATNLYRIAKYLFSLLRGHKEEQLGDRPSGKELIKRLANVKTAQTVGFKPSINLFDGLEDTVDIDARSYIPNGHHPETPVDPDFVKKQREIFLAEKQTLASKILPDHLEGLRLPTATPLTMGAPIPDEPGALFEIRYPHGAARVYASAGLVTLNNRLVHLNGKNEVLHNIGYLEAANLTLWSSTEESFDELTHPQHSHRNIGGWIYLGDVPASQIKNIPSWDGYWVHKEQGHLISNKQMTRLLLTHALEHFTDILDDLNRVKASDLQIEEVNVREFMAESNYQSFDDVSNERLTSWRTKGVNTLWMMSVFEESPMSRQINEQHGDPSFSGWAASAYAIPQYNVNFKFGGDEAFERFVERAKIHGLRVVVDFVPNHMAIDTPLLDSHPEMFIYRTEPPSTETAIAYFKRTLPDGRTVWFRHGRGGKLPWIDTVEINFLNEGAWLFFKEQLTKLGNLTSGGGIRVDALNSMNIRTYQQKLYPDMSFEEFQSKLQGILHEVFNAVPQKTEQPLEVLFDWFHKKYPDATIIGENYGDDFMWQQAGVDLTNGRFVYTWLVENGDGGWPSFIDFVFHQGNFAHLPPSFFERIYTYLEDHDVHVRVLEALRRRFGDKDHVDAEIVAYSKLLATAISTIPGVPLIYGGQREGRIKTISSANVIQAHQEPPLSDEVKDLPEFYESLLKMTGNLVFRRGSMPKPIPIVEGGNPQLVAFVRSHRNQNGVVVLNHSAEPVQVTLDLSPWKLKQKTLVLPPWGTYVDIVHNDRSLSYFDHWAYKWIVSWSLESVLVAVFSFLVALVGPLAGWILIPDSTGPPVWSFVVSVIMVGFKVAPMFVESHFKIDRWLNKSPPRDRKGMLFGARLLHVISTVIMVFYAAHTHIFFDPLTVSTLFSLFASYTATYAVGHFLWNLFASEKNNLSIVKGDKNSSLPNLEGKEFQALLITSLLTGELNLHVERIDGGPGSLIYNKDVVLPVKSAAKVDIVFVASIVGRLSPGKKAVLLVNAKNYQFIESAFKTVLARGRVKLIRVKGADLITPDNLLDMDVAEAIDLPMNEAETQNAVMMLPPGVLPSRQVGRDSWLWRIKEWIVMRDNEWGVGMLVSRLNEWLRAGLRALQAA